MFFVWWLKSGRDNKKIIIWLSLFGFALDMPKKCSIFGCKTNYHSEKKNENLVVEQKKMLGTDINNDKSSLKTTMDRNCSKNKC